MMVFVYEYVSGGGFLGRQEPPEPSLLREGRAMLAAVCEDFQKIPGVRAVTTSDARWPLSLSDCEVHHVASSKEQADRRAALAKKADWTLIIAPEFDGILAAVRREVVQAGGRLLGPNPGLTALLSQKQATCEHLARAGLAVPFGLLLDGQKRLPGDFPYPAVLKRDDGAGSLEMQLIRDAQQAAGVEPVASPRRLERLCPGQPASVAVLCGPELSVPLAPCWQRIDPEHGFAYQGGSLIRDADLVDRATDLALAAVGALDGPRGYLGVDMILAESESGGENRDVLVEVNPRLTTSYIGLRAATRQNLAEAMLAIISGEDPHIQFDDDPLEFDPSGRIVPPLCQGWVNGPKRPPHAASVRLLGFTKDVIG